MNQQNAHEWLPLIQAMADGKTIQFLDDGPTPGGDWFDVQDLDMTYEPDDFRIKSEPRTFHMWLASSGVMYPEELFITGTPPYEFITVQEVLA